MQRLQRIDQHAGDISPTTQHRQRALRHLGQCQGPVGRGRIADAGLHLAPPSVIGAAEPHQLRTSRVVAGQPDRLHDRLGAGHVERHLVEARDGAQPDDVFRHHRMIGTERYAEVAGALDTGLHALLVEIVTEEVHAIRAGQVVEHVAVEVGDGGALRRLQERSGGELVAHPPAELERHTIGGGELQIRDDFAAPARHRHGARVTVAVQLRQPREAVAALSHHRLRRVIASEELLVTVLVERDQAGDASRPAHMAGERRVLGARQLQPRPAANEQVAKRCTARHHRRQRHQARPHLQAPRCTQ